MIFKSKSMKSLDRATAVLDEVNRIYEPQLKAGTLTDADREKIREQLHIASGLEERSRSESRFSLLGDYVAMVRHFRKTGRFFMTDKGYMQELRNVVSQAEAHLAKLQEADPHLG